PARRSGLKPRSGRRKPKENGTAAAARGSPVSLNGTTGNKGKGRGSASVTGALPGSQNGPRKARGEARSSTSVTGAPPGSQNGTGAPAQKPRGAPPVPSKLVAMDCEMVGTGPGGRTSALARCSIVSYHGD
ncbi:AEN nuclease, partial [Prunella fulvescens]|nr:AEN nuclease [Prunella fulvescens]